MNIQPAKSAVVWLSRQLNLMCWKNSYLMKCEKQLTEYPAYRKNRCSYIVSKNGEEEKKIRIFKQKIR